MSTRKFLAGLLLLCTGINISVMAQELIIIQDTSLRDENCVPPKVTDACVTIITKKNLELAFTSSVDKVVHVASRSEFGEYYEYNLTFPTDDLQYLDRILYINCQHFPNQAKLNLMLEAKESLRFYVSISECYGIHLKNGVNYFTQAAYLNAKDEFLLAKECFDAPTDGVAVAKIGEIDSILFFRTVAKEQFELLDYQAAMATYTKILDYNPNDNHARQKYNECQQENIKLCDKYMLRAYKYYQEGDYEKARILYNRVLSYNCYTDEDESFQTLKKTMEKIEKLDLKKKELKTALTYQWAVKTPFGFSVGAYRDRKWGGYFTFLFNPSIFESFRGNFPTQKKPEIDGVVGATVRPVNNKYTPFWIAFGMGYTGVGVQDKHTVYHAISPEVGILAKVPFGKNAKIGLAVRYTFQFRFALDHHYQKYVNPISNIFGLGLCF